ncbi:MAG: mono/diheme cytochrome c family protein [Patescibacteria group bacterium]|jgi:mono/diheme cytochrome c family protein
MYSLRLFESLISLSWTALVLVISILALLIYNSNNTIENPMFNGASVVVTTIDENIEKERDNPILNKGKALFKNNCATCHNKNMTDKLRGPALGGVIERWADYPKEDLYHWIRNSQKLIREKHPRAVKLIKEWKSPMNAFPNLNDKEIKAILIYIER